MEEKPMDDVYESRDKQIVPFLLTQQDTQFIGTRRVDSVMYFQFTPLARCKTLVNLFVMKKAPLVQAKDLLDALESFRDMVFEMKDKTYERFK